jgi:amino acid adenylation domain-containing protein
MGKQSTVKSGTKAAGLVVDKTVSYRRSMIHSNDTIVSATRAALGTANVPDHRDDASHESIMARIASYAADMPNRAAVVDGSGVISYGELEARSNQLAHHLIAAGAGGGNAVVLLFDRSTDFVVAALAVLKTGGAYVAVDSATPADRTAFVLADSGASVLLTHHGKARGVAMGDTRIVEVDGTDAAQIARQPRTAPAIDYSPDNLAYLVYTSGSTGRPKGVEITHANVNCLIEWHQTAFGLTPADRASHVSGLGFDVVAWELWANLTAGAALHVADEMTRRSAEDLQRWVVDRQITICFAPTVIAEQLLHAQWPKNTALRWLLIGGEALHRRPAAHLPFAVANCYGPSECTVVATSGRVVAGGDQTPTIGRPIHHTRAFILDDNLLAVADGEAGELCLAGAHVGRGYRNNPVLTAQQFVLYTSGDDEKPIRIYRTGDRARLLANGELVFLGRLDDQVKIRGYRIGSTSIHRSKRVAFSHVIAAMARNYWRTSSPISLQHPKQQRCALTSPPKSPTT